HAMKTRILILALAMLALSGCVTTQTPVKDVAMQNQFSAADLEPYAHAGTASIIGQAFLTTRGGDVKVGAGREVVLLPATVFVKEAMTHIDRGYRPAAYQAARAEIHKVARTTIADAEGRFEFVGVPAGDYILQTEITWQVSGD